jgi:glycosyltransferase involved in cell wall biosynthesis
MSSSLKNPIVSILIPVRNEQKYIRACLMSLLRGTYQREAMEVLVVDGMSDDATRTEVEAVAAEYPEVRVYANPDRVVPNAMNVGIRAARGEYVVRVDAHATYPRDYVERLVKAMETLKADNVGGVFISIAASETAEAHAVAAILSSSFGVGNAIYRLRSDGAPIEVDTVPFGCYRREIFQRIGLFDEIFIRNQDDEFNARVRRAGGRIFLLPDLHIQYVARESIRKMGLMLYQYGYFKPLVAMKLGRPATLRQLAPPAFTLAVIGLPLIAPWVSLAGYAWLAAVGAHSLANLAASAIAARKAGWRILGHLFVGFLYAHLSYGFGYLRGIFDFGVLREHTRAKKQTIPLSR